MVACLFGVILGDAVGVHRRLVGATRRRQIASNANSVLQAPSELEVGMVCRGHCFGNGLIMRAVGDRMIVAPPLVITREQIDEMVVLVRRCLDLTLADVQRNGWMQ